MTTKSCVALSKTRIWLSRRSLDSHICRNVRRGKIGLTLRRRIPQRRVSLEREKEKERREMIG